MALPKRRRIKSKKDINRIFKTGRSFRTASFLVKIAKNNLPFCRGAVIVPSKLVSGAVLRNKVRRKLSTVLASAFTFCKVRVDVVVVVQSGFKEAELQKTNQSLLEIFRKANVV